MNTQEVIQKAAAILRAQVPEGSEVFLFGSQARGDTHPDSDVDFLVIEPKVESRFDETNRLAKALAWMRIGYDIIVLSRADFEDWREVPGSLPYRVAREGKVLS